MSSKNVPRTKKIFATLVYCSQMKMGNRPGTRTVRYYVCPGNFPGREEKFLHETIQDKRGWARMPHYSFEQTRRKADADIWFHMATSQWLKQAFGRTGNGLSVTVTGGDGPAEVYFNKTNWNHPPHKFSGDITTYRQYLIQHELGHAVMNLKDVSLKHYDESLPCPVMYQQSLGTSERCAPNPWVR